MSGTIPPLPSTPSWRVAQLKKSTGATLYLNFIVFKFFLKSERVQRAFLLINFVSANLNSAFIPFRVRSKLRFHKSTWTVLKP
jgi:hypothetical protein